MDKKKAMAAAKGVAKVIPLAVGGWWLIGGWSIIATIGVLIWQFVPDQRKGELAQSKAAQMFKPGVKLVKDMLDIGVSMGIFLIAKVCYEGFGMKASLVLLAVSVVVLFIWQLILPTPKKRAKRWKFVKKSIRRFATGALLYLTSLAYNSEVAKEVKLAIVKLIGDVWIDRIQLATIAIVVLLVLRKLLIWLLVQRAEAEKKREKAKKAAKAAKAAADRKAAGEAAARAYAPHREDARAEAEARAAGGGAP